MQVPGRRGATGRSSACPHHNARTRAISRWPWTSLALTELLDAVGAGGDIDIIRSAVQLMLQALIDAEAEQVIGAGRYERTGRR